MTHINEGDTAPSIEALDQNGNAVSLNRYRGKKVILYFYPKDMTPGCTMESCNLRDNYSDLKSKGFEVIGVSADSPEKHQKFISKYDLPFTLISDVDKKVISDYGVWGPKKFMGKTYDGIHRTTFVIDKEGNIEKIFRKVNTNKHTSQIMEELQL